MINVKHLKIVKKMGLSENESKCYLALMERQSLSVAEIAKLTGIARPNVYEATERLLIKGLSVELPGKAKCFSASDPKILQEKALANINETRKVELENFEKKRKEIVDLSDEISELNALYNQNRGNSGPLDYIEILKNPDQIHRRFLQLCNESQKEILGFSKPPYVASTSEREAGQGSVQAEAYHERGVSLRSIYEIPSDEVEKESFFKRLCDGYEPEKEQIKIMDKLPMKMIIFDEETVLFTLEDPVQGIPSITSLCAKHHALAEGLKTMFEVYWGLASDYFMLKDREYYMPELGKIRSKKNGRKSDD